MRILLTNDDGIAAPGLRLLAQFAQKIAGKDGEVLIVAPLVEHSGRSQSIEIHKPFVVKKSALFEDMGLSAYCVHSTPTDCVRFSMDRFGHFDYIFSGINPGMNLGLDISYSATCGAAFEATYWGVRAMAVSSDLGCLEVAADKIGEIWEYIQKNDLFAHCQMCNVNVPRDPKGIRLTAQGGPYYRDSFFPVEEDVYEARYHVEEKDEKDLDLGIDTDAVRAGYCSVSPLLAHRTDFETLKKLSRQ